MSLWEIRTQKGRKVGTQEATWSRQPSTSQGERLERDPSLWPSEEANPAYVRITDSYPQNCEQLDPCCFSPPPSAQPVTLCYGSLSQLIHAIDNIQLQPFLSSSKLSSTGIDWELLSNEKVLWMWGREKTLYGQHNSVICRRLGQKLRYATVPSLHQLAVFSEASHLISQSLSLFICKARDWIGSPLWSRIILTSYGLSWLRQESISYCTPTASWMRHIEKDSG